MSFYKLPFGRPSIKQLKRSGEIFIQDKPCHAWDGLPKCLECKWVKFRGNKENIICRFYGFRKLRYTI